jgi:hypothetical protein
MFLCGVDLSDELMDLFKLTDSRGEIHMGVELITRRNEWGWI